MFLLIGDFIYTKMYIRAAQTFHDSMLYSVLRCNMQFFESTPIGRILNRFSKDIEATETKIPEFLRMFIRTFQNVLSVVVVISITQPFFLLFFFAISFGYVFFQVNIPIRISVPLENVTYIKKCKSIESICEICTSVETYGIGEPLANIRILRRIVKWNKYNPSVCCPGQICSHHDAVLGRKYKDILF